MRFPELIAKLELPEELREIFGSCRHQNSQPLPIRSNRGDRRISSTASRSIG
ncbi:hypothetical protein [Chamaesiphon sp. OTE_75_metabat_556]|uniref:hypothetical protein n=1 Tax=Chamaesiphon sp. OTE_75_metabat_556 TaxID=2964692 RepID=UPI00286BB67C|nr:hypothetical protein [Chamaesiphon sp. OTE_75_metabat_556]